MICVECIPSDGAGFSRGYRRGWYTGGVKQFGHRAGRGGDTIPSPGRDKIDETGESVLSALPFSVPASSFSFPVPDAVQRALAVHRRAGIHAGTVGSRLCVASLRAAPRPGQEIFADFRVPDAVQRVLAVHRRAGTYVVMRLWCRAALGTQGSRIELARQIAPIGIEFFDQLDFPGAPPALQRMFAGSGLKNGIVGDRKSVV